MTEARSAPPHAPPTAVQRALDDPEIRDGLAHHAAARLGALLADRPASVREDVARDSIQEAMRRALDAEHTLDLTSGTPTAWLHGILERVLHEQCRALRKQPSQPCTDPEGWDRLETRLSEPDYRVPLNALLTHLDEEQRRIVTMHHLDGMSHEAIASALGITVGNSRVRLARAMTELKRIARGDVR